MIAETVALITDNIPADVVVEQHDLLEAQAVFTGMIYRLDVATAQKMRQLSGVDLIVSLLGKAYPTIAFGSANDNLMHVQGEDVL